MPKWVYAALLIGSPAWAAWAQTDTSQPPPHVQAPSPGADTCTDVQVGSAASYSCLNARLGAIAAAQPRPSSALDAPISASSPGYRTGAANESATRNRLGSNFGKSVTPERPRP